MPMLIALWAVLGLLIGGLISRLASVLAENRNLAALVGQCPGCRAPVGLLVAGPALVRPVEVCPSCGSRLREPWPLGEVLGAASFGLLAWRFDSIGPLILYSAFATLLILVTLIDLREKLILDVVTFPAVVAALAISFVTMGPLASLAGGLLAGGAMLFFFLLAVLIYRRGDALGLGDVKLSFLIGLVVGGGAAINAVIFGVLAGGLIAVVVLAISRDRKMAIPYGPSLALGALIAILTQPTVWR